MAKAKQTAAAARKSKPAVARAKSNGRPVIARPSVSRDQGRASTKTAKQKPIIVSSEQERRLLLLWWRRRMTVLKYLRCRKRVELPNGQSRWSPALPAIPWEWIALDRAAGVYMTVARVKGWWTRQRKWVYEHMENVRRTARLPSQARLTL